MATRFEDVATTKNASSDGKWERGQGIGLPTQTSFDQALQDGRYKAIYDGKGLHTGKTSNSNPNSTWYAFNVVSVADDKVVAEYHIHPAGYKNRYGREVFKSGNMHVPSGTSGQTACIGRATDWIDFCHYVKQQIG